MADKIDAKSTDAAGTGTGNADDKVDVVTHDSAEGADEGNNNDDAADDKVAEGNDDADGADGDDKVDEGNDDDDDGDDSAEGADEDTDDDDVADEDTDDDELDDDELEAVDAKVRRKINKVQRENANLRTRLKEAQGNTTKADARADKAEVALAAGLSPEAVKFLNGTTREELEENAEALLVMLGYNGRVTQSNGPAELGSNPRRSDVDPAASANRVTDLDTIGARMYNR